MVCEDITFTLVRKPVRSFTLRVAGPDVRVSAPLRAPDTDVSRFVHSRLAWIRARIKHPVRAHFLPSYRNGTTVDLSGVTFLLVVCLDRSLARDAGSVVVAGGEIRMTVRPRAGRLERERLVFSLYRRHLQQIIPLMVARWQPRIGRAPSHLSYRVMRSRWGSCRKNSARLTFNVLLASRSPGLVEGVVVHELAHLIHSNHGPRFRALMDLLLPDWRAREGRLNGGAVD